MKTTRALHITWCHQAILDSSDLFLLDQTRAVHLKLGWSWRGSLVEINEGIMQIVTNQALRTSCQETVRKLWTRLPAALQLLRGYAEAVDSSSSGSSTKASSSSAEDIYGCLKVTSFFQSRSLSWRCTWYRASSTSSRSGAVVGTSSCAGGGSPASTSQGALTNCAYVVVCSLAIRDAREFFWRRHSATHSSVAMRSGKRGCDEVRDSFAPTDVWARHALVWRLKQ